jgi:hypothetical protein
MIQRPELGVQRLTAQNQEQHKENVKPLALAGANFAKNRGQSLLKTGATLKI